MSCTAEMILEATAILAHTQAADPLTKDGIGFNNADFPLGLTLAAAGAIAPAAALLFCYPDQLGAYGLTRDDLLEFLPKETAEKGRSEARRVMSEARAQVAGKVAFAKVGEDEVLFNGVRLDAFTVDSLKRLGAKRTTTGYTIKATKINALKGLIGEDKFIDVTGLDAIASQHEQVTIATATGVAPKKSGFTIKIKNLAGNLYLDWEYAKNNATFDAIKDIVKPMSSGFNSGIGWLVTPNQLVMVAMTLVEEGLEGVDISALLPHSNCTDEKILDLRDEIRSGSLKVKVWKHDEKTISLFIRKYDSVFVEACKSVRGRYNGEPTKSWTIGKSDLPKVIATLLNYSRFDLSLLDEHIVESVKAMPAAEPVKIEGIEQTPTGCKLFPHQIGDVEFLLQDFASMGVKGGLLANDMGLGKTLSSMYAAHIKCPAGRKLVVVPSVAKENWLREIKRFLGEDQTVQIVMGRTDKIGDAKWVVINYDIISYYKQALIDAKFSYVIMDEVHMLKNLKAQRTQALVSYWDAKNQIMVPGITDSIPNVLPMSGTPMLNRPNELFPLLRALGHNLGKSKNKYEERYCGGEFITVNKFGKQVWTATGATHSDELAAKVSPFFRKLYKKDCLSLPPKIRTSIPVEISETEKKRFSSLFDAMEAAEATDEEGNSTGEILKLINTLKYETAKIKVAASIEQAEDIVAAGEKVIIFTSYTDILNEIVARFGDKAVFVDGSVTGTKRTAAMDAFQNDEKIQVFVGNTKACGVAITLTAASHVIFNDREWTPGLIEQAEDRAYRIGQTKMVNVYHMTAEGTFDEELVAALDGKSTLIFGWEAAAISGEGAEQVEAPTSVRKALFDYIKSRKQAA